MTKYKLINLNEFSNDQIYLDKLDNRFIDKEELKEKIELIDKEVLDKIKIEKGIADILLVDRKQISDLFIAYKNDILELLK
ncbi:MAG TPA: hypothetical protein P5098_00450 [Candidatus Dojkabacteria bacterium]|nr:hypothetical protein [Candidatus Dojkabacteria bacterium]